jgi:hypothetical protein
MPKALLQRGSAFINTVAVADIHHQRLGEAFTSGLHGRRIERFCIAS